MEYLDRRSTPASQHPLSIAIEELRTDKLTVGFREEVIPEDEAVQAAMPEEETIVATDEAAEEAEAEAWD